MVESKYFSNYETFIKLWIHEVLRVFGDRLISNTDLKEVQTVIVGLCKNKLRQQDASYDHYFKTNIYFGEIHKGEGTSRFYQEIADMKVLNRKLIEFSDAYNKANKKAVLSLVFFDYAVMHILRITRILRQPRGSIVLIGNGGTGKQVLFYL
jgi:dynein heavy chain